MVLKEVTRNLLLFINRNNLVNYYKKWTLYDILGQISCVKLLFVFRMHYNIFPYVCTIVIKNTSYTKWLHRRIRRYVNNRLFIEEFTLPINAHRMITLQAYVLSSFFFCCSLVFYLRVIEKHVECKHAYWDVVYRKSIKLVWNHRWHFYR